MRSIGFAKGHGTHNDFVVVLDRTNLIGLSEDDVRFLCDRRGGIGADGVLRVTRAGSIPEWDGDPDLWFMDYRNADGSIAEMCGNGLRVFGRYLYDENLVAREPVTVGTRAGLRTVDPQGDGTLVVTMGPATVAGDRVSVATMTGKFEAVPVDVGNPHAVAFLDDDVAGLDFYRAPSWSPAERFPDGVNLEFCNIVGPDHLRMRVYERGSGETMSCGTGVVAVAAAYAARTPGSSRVVTVDVPGGRLSVDLTGEQALLGGPAEIVARGQVNLP